MTVSARRPGSVVGVLLIVSLFSVTPARAALISYSVFAAPITCDSTLLAGCTGSLSLDLFDSTLGTLTSVGVDIQGDAAMQLGFTIGNANVAKIGATTAVSVTDPMSHSFVVSIDGLLDVNGLDKDATYPLGYFPVVVSPGSAAFSYSLPTDLAPFIGTGPAQFPAFGITALTTAIPGPQLSGISVESLATLNATVTYVYDDGKPLGPLTSVPEPATYALFGLGLLAVARRLRRG